MENGLRSHWYFIRGLKNQMRSRLLLSQVKYKFDSELSRFEVITLEELCRGSFALLFIGLSLSSLSLLFEIFKKCNDGKIFKSATNKAKHVAW